MDAMSLQSLRTYWEELRAGRIAPYRAELDPRRFEDLLEHMFIVEVVAPGQMRVRLAGLGLCEAMGMEVRGMPPEALMAAAHRASFTQHLATVLSAPAVVELDLTATDTTGTPVSGAMLLLPLRSDFGEVTRILACALTSRRKLRAPANFSIVAHRVSVIPADGAEAADPLPGFSEIPTDYAPPPSVQMPRAVIDNPEPRASEPRRGHLRVISRN